MARDRGRPRNEQLSVDKAWLKRRMDELGIKYFSDLAKEIGIDKTMVTRSLSGGRMLTITDVAGLATALRVSADEIIRRFGLSLPTKGVPIVGRITSDGKISQIVGRKGALFRVDDMPPNAEALIAETDGGPLAFADGATFVYQPSVSSSLSIPSNALGRLCIIEADSHLTPFLGTLDRGSSRSGFTIELFGSREKIKAQHVHRASPVLAIHFA